MDPHHSALGPWSRGGRLYRGHDCIHLSIGVAAMSPAVDRCIDTVTRAHWCVGSISAYACQFRPNAAEGVRTKTYRCFFMLFSSSGLL